MKVLILGGTGAMGSHLVKLLNQEGTTITVTTRSNRKSFDNVSYVTGNAKDQDFIVNLLKQKWDVIVDFMVYNTVEFSKRVALLLNSTSQYIFISSSRVYDDSLEPIKETNSRLLDVSDDKEFLSTDEYSLTKARQENLLIESGKNNWTIIRPYITYSSNRLQLGILEKENWLFRALKGRTIVFSEEINNCCTTMTSGLDVAKGIVSIIGKTDALGEIFHITSNKSVKWRCILDIYLNVLESNLGFRPKVLLENTDEFFKYHNAKYQIKYDRLFNRQFDNTKINKYIDVSNFTEIEIGIKNSLVEFLNNPTFKNLDWRAEALKDRKTREYTSLKDIKGFRQKIKYVLFRFFIK
ncbi:MAG: NAD-dependent epimerase/dehydratase family protein [Tissierellia bacterium]|nr:NAD-dependent epimerase/dehydratase family protein [Tissierellia bacterium]